MCKSRLRTMRGKSIRVQLKTNLLLLFSPSPLLTAFFFSCFSFDPGVAKLEAKARRGGGLLIIKGFPQFPTTTALSYFPSSPSSFPLPFLVLHDTRSGGRGGGGGEREAWLTRDKGRTGVEMGRGGVEGHFSSSSPSLPSSLLVSLTGNMPGTQVSSSSLPPLFC